MEIFYIFVFLGQNYLGFCDSTEDYFCGFLNGTCLNGGICVETGTSFYECRCKNGYFGKFCESIEQSCSDDTCLNGGYCSQVYINKYNGYYSFECSCTNDFTGPHCELKRCSSPYYGGNGATCLNGGTCLNLNVYGSFLCRCKEGFTGLYCESEVTRTTTTMTTTTRTNTNTATTTTTRRTNTTTATTTTITTTQRPSPKFLFKIELSIKITNLFFTSDYNNLSSAASISLQNEYFSLVYYFKILK